jgi:hypothetical protein
MSSIEIPTSIKINNRDIKFRAIHKDFSQTKPGNRLANNARWPKYQGKLNNSEWQKMLGFDINNLEHGRLTYGITRSFIKKTNQSESKLNFNQEEQKLLLLTSLVHDWPEGITKCGDVSYDQRTIQHEKEELAVIEKAITDILGPQSSNISKQIKDILENKNSKLGKTFNIIEKIGYVRTGLISWKKSKNTNKNIFNLNCLTKDVVSIHIPELIKHSYYPPVSHFLKNKQNIISEIFSNMPTSVFDRYNPIEEKNKNIAKFNKASDNWTKWIS